MRMLKPVFLSLRRTFSPGNPGNRIKIAGISLMALGFFSLEFAFIARMLLYFAKTEIIGSLMIEKMLYMADFIFFAMLIFSNIVTSISTYYTSDDLVLVLSTPATMEEFYYARLVQTIVKSSWMVLLFGLPVYLAYGVILHGGILYYLLALTGLLAFIVIAAVTGVLFSMAAAYVLPARRFRELMLFVSIVAFIGVYVGFRLVRPERFLDPQRFENLLGYMSTLRSSQSMLLPTTWLSSSLMSSLYHAYPNALFMLLMLVATALGITVTGMLATYLFYRTGFTKAQEAKTARLNRKGMMHRALELLTSRSSVFVDAVIRKDVLSFFRDTSQWSQLLLLGALVLVYVYNFTVLPLRNIPFPTVYIKNIVAFFNLGLAAFVVTAIAARFAFPSISLEGRALWLIKVSPNDPSELIRAKIVYNLVPLLIAAAALVFFTNYVLGVFRYIMYLSLVTMTLLTVSITNMGVGFGAIYPKYHYENVADIAMGYGGLFFMLTSLGVTTAVLIVQAIPTYRVMEGLLHVPPAFNLYTYVWVSLLYLLSGAIIVYPALYVRAKALKAIKITEG